MAEQPVIGLNTRLPDGPGKGPFRIPHQYVDAIREAGGIPLCIPVIADTALLREELEKVQGFVFIGGRDYPSHLYGEEQHPKAKLLLEPEWRSDRALADLVLETTLPVLAICGGLQLVNIALGGKLLQHIPNAGAHTARREGDSYHTVKITGGNILAGLFGKGEITVNSAHHQAVDPAAVGQGLVITAYAADGTVEAMESTSSRFLLGVQWHPERMQFPGHRKKVFAAFVEAIT